MTLHRLLDDELRFSPSFRGVYSNHLAMELVALHRLGADERVLADAFDRHATNESEPRTDRDDLDAVIADVQRDGIETVVRARLPMLLHGPGTALFHPAIRLAYGLAARHEGQVAAALLDWERRLHVLPLAEPATGHNQHGARRLTAVAADLARAGGGQWRPTFDLDEVARRPELVDALDGLAVDDATLDDVSAFALAAHATADAFVTLHLVTGAQAVRAIAEVLDAADATALAGHTARTMAVAYAAVGAPRLIDPAQLDALRSAPWPQPEVIAARAIVDLDPHVVKLADVALVEDARTGDAGYRFLAARVVGLAG